MKCILAIFLAAVAGCSNDSASLKFTAETPVLQATSERIVFRARYHQTTGPCIDLGNGTLGMPMMDQFVQVEMIEGSPKISGVDVRPESAEGPRYPVHLVEGRVYKLVLNPSERTTKMLQDASRTSNIVIDGTELEDADVPTLTVPATTQK